MPWLNIADSCVCSTKLWASYWRRLQGQLRILTHIIQIFIPPLCIHVFTWFDFLHGICLVKPIMIHEQYFIYCTVLKWVVNIEKDSFKFFFIWKCSHMHFIFTFMDDCDKRRLWLARKSYFCFELSKTWYYESLTACIKNNWTNPLWGHP